MCTHRSNLGSHIQAMLGFCLGSVRDSLDNTFLPI